MPPIPSIASADEEPFRFLDLPTELRNRIYRFALVAPEGIKPVVGEGEVPTSEQTIEERAAVQCGGYIRRRISISETQPVLTKVCRQVRSESLPLFYAENTFEFDPRLYNSRGYVRRWFKTISKDNLFNLRCVRVCVNATDNSQEDAKYIDLEITITVRKRKVCDKVGHKITVEFSKPIDGPNSGLLHTMDFNMEDCQSRKGFDGSDLFKFIQIFYWRNFIPLEWNPERGMSVYQIMFRKREGSVLDKKSLTKLATLTAIKSTWNPTCYPSRLENEFLTALCEADERPGRAKAAG